MTDIRSWLEAQDLGRHAEAFLAQDLTVDLLPELAEADLKELGLASMGDRKRFLRAVAQRTALGESVAVAPSAAASTSALGSASAAVEAPTAAFAAEDGERRHATVMFSDLTGYTALNEAFDPEEVEAVMGRVKREAVAVIERHGGRVNQFVGDEVMAMFGIPVARRDDPRRAVAAALELHGVVDGIAQGLKARLGRTVALHTGIQTGLMIARRSDARAGEFLLTGDTVNTAARLRGLAMPGEVVVSAQTWQQVSDWFDGEAGAPVEVKGKERPLVPWRIVAERAVPKAGGGPLVGRAEEMRQFQALVEACVRRQRGRTVFVRGDPGMGKSRLVAEYLYVAREQGLACHAVTVLDFGARTGRDALRALLQSLLGLAPDADEAERTEGITRFAAQSPVAGGHAPFLYDLLDVTPPARARSLLSALDLTSRQRFQHEALSHVVLVAQASGPLLLLVEDIQWADAWTLKQLGALAGLTARTPLLLVMSTRFGGDPSMGDWRTSLHGLPVTGIDLGPLLPEDALRLAAGAASMSEALLHGCVERAEGNPLFLEQLLLNAGDESATSLPGSIQALVQARMDRLVPSDKAALQAAAVWGQRVPLAVMRHLTGEQAYDPRVLIEQFLLRPEDEVYVFCHALIRDGAYGSLLHARRRQLHQSAAEWVEARDVALAAEHFECAEDPRAAGACLRASEVLAAGYDYAPALALVERGLKLLPEGPRENGSGGFGLKLARSRLLRELGRAVESVEAAALAVACASSDAERALGLISQAAGMRLTDRSQEGLQLLALAEPLAEAAGMTLELSRLHELRGNLYFMVGTPQQCLAQHERARLLAREAGSAEMEAAAWGGIGDALMAQGHILQADAAIGNCLRLAREHGFLRVEVSYLALKAFNLLYQLKMDEAVRVSSEANVLARRIGQLRAEMMSCAQMALLDGWIRGNVSAVLPLIERGLEIARGFGSARFEAMAWQIRSQIAWREGKADEARAFMATCVERGGLAAQSFFGAQLFASRARVAEGWEAQHALLAQGEALLRTEFSNSRMSFCETAIQIALAARQWDEAWRYCELLEAYAERSPYPWSIHITQLSRALVRAGRGERGAALEAELREVRECELSSGYALHLPRVDAALAALASG